MLLVAVAGEAGAGMDEPVIHGDEACEPSAAQFLLPCVEGGRGRALVGGGGGGSGGYQPLFGLELLLLPLRELDLVLERRWDDDEE